MNRKNFIEIQKDNEKRSKKNWKNSWSMYQALEREEAEKSIVRFDKKGNKIK